MCQFFAPLMVPAIMFDAILFKKVSRLYWVGPPGSLFFIMAASIGAYTPIELTQLPLMVGLIFMGSLLACPLGFFYSLQIPRLRPPKPVPPLPKPGLDFVVVDSTVIGVFVGISLASDWTKQRL